MTTMSVRRALAGTAVVLGALAPLARGAHAPETASLDVTRLATEIEGEYDHVTAMELASWIKARKLRLRVIDVRAAAAFDEYHIPTAERMTLGALAVAPFATDDTIVLYSQEGAHAAQGWVLLRARGYAHVYFLRGGLADWIDDIMNPTLAAGASAADSEAFQRAAEISRYFGGVPRTKGPAEDRPGGARTPSAAGAAVQVRRRGC